MLLQLSTDGLVAVGGAVSPESRLHRFGHIRLHGADLDG